MASLFLFSFFILSVSILILVSRPIILECLRMRQTKQITKIQEIHNSQLKDYAKQINIQNEKFNNIHNKMDDFVKSKEVSMEKKETILKYLIEETKDETKKKNI